MKEKHKHMTQSLHLRIFFEVFISKEDFKQKDEKIFVSYAKEPTGRSVNNN